jgi:hypothetical protein
MSSPPRDPENVARDPEVLALRNAGPDPIVGVREADGEGRGSDADDREHAQRGLLASPEAAALLEFSGIDGRERERARAFLDGTDYAEATVYADRRRVGECYRLRLCWVIWSESQVRTQYARTYRDWDVACSADRDARTLRLIRIPAALDPGAVSSYGSGVHTRGCVPPRRGGVETGGDTSNGTENASNGTENASDRRPPGGRP